MNDKAIYSEIFTQLLTEEWRLHKSLFGGSRFILFPVVLAVLSVSLVMGIDYLQIPSLTTEVLLGGFHMILLLFGLQTGLLVFANRDELENLLNDYTPLLYRAKTVSEPEKTFILLFMIKDAIYYGVLIILPIVLGFGLVLTPFTLSLVYVSLLYTFIMGIAITIVTISLSNTFGKLFGVKYIVLLTALGIYLVSQLSLSSIQPYIVLTTGSVPQIISVAVISIITVVGSVKLFNSGEYNPSQNTYIPAITSPDINLAITQKTKTDIKRSTGGYIILIASILTAIVVAFGLIRILEPIAQPMNDAIFSGVVIMMMLSFVIYAELTRHIEPSNLRLLGLTINQVLHENLRLYMILAVIPATIGSVLISNSLLGVPLTVGLGLYFYLVLVYFAGIELEETLFDVVRFAGVTVFIGIALLPLLMFSLFADPSLWVSAIQLVYPDATLSTFTSVSAGYFVVLSIVAIYLNMTGFTKWDYHYIK